MQKTNFEYPQDFMYGMNNASEFELKQREKNSNWMNSAQRYMEPHLKFAGVHYIKEFIIMTFMNGIPKFQFLDFFVPQKMIAIEIDGKQHRDRGNINQMNLDACKNAWCLHYNIPLIRICSHIGHVGRQIPNTGEFIHWSLCLSNDAYTFTSLQCGSGFDKPY
jgi:hypothetical protein